MGDLLNDKFKDLNKIIAILESELNNLLNENKDLSDNTIKLNQQIKEKAEINNKLTFEITTIKSELDLVKNEPPQNFTTHKNENSITLGINNLSVRNNEAIHDALSYFEKQCPYCGEQLFNTTKRKQFEIEHFFPVVKGGQDVPWNLLPICQSCNRKKRDALPHNFLNQEAFKKVSSYLDSVHIKYLAEAIDSYTFKEKIGELLKIEHDFIRKHINSKFISTLLYLAEKHTIINEITKINNELTDIVDDGSLVLITNYLNRELPLNWHDLNLIERKEFLNSEITSETVINQKLEARKFVCISEIWCECLGKDKKDMDRSASKNLNSLMKNFDDWIATNTTKRFSFHGTQKYYQRKK